MITLDLQETGMTELLNIVIAVGSLMAALFALWQTRRSNRSADEANRIAKQAMQMQEDESRIRLVVQPQMLLVIGDGEDSRARPVVRVINLSAFPVTIEKIWWRTAHPTNGFIWKNPTVNEPFGSLPARLGSRQALTAIGTPDSFKTVEDFLSITAAVAYTECGESVEGSTPQWNEYREKVCEKDSLHWNE